MSLLTSWLLSGGCIFKNSAHIIWKAFFLSSGEVYNRFLKRTRGWIPMASGFCSSVFSQRFFFKAGKEVWNWCSSFCPQPSWMQMKSFMQKGLKPEQQPRCQNLKMTSRREKLFPWFQGKTQSMPLVCSSKKEIPPRQLWIKNASRVVLSRLLLEQELTKPSPSNPEVLQSSGKIIDKSLTKRLSSVSIGPFLRTWTSKTPTP